MSAALIVSAKPRAKTWQRFRYVDGPHLVVTRTGRSTRVRHRVLLVALEHPKPGLTVERLVPSDAPTEDLERIARFYGAAHVPAWYAEFSARMGVPLRGDS